MHAYLLACVRVCILIILRVILFAILLSLFHFITKVPAMCIVAYREATPFTRPKL